MSDPITTILGSLRNQPPPTSFAPVEAVRRRGRQRARRQLAASVAAVVLATGLGASGAVVWLDRGPTGPSNRPTAGPTASPPVTTSPSAPGSPSAAPTGAGVASVLLQLSDLGPGTWRRSASDPLEGARSYWDADPCLAYRGGHPSLSHQLSRSHVSYVNGSGARITELVESYQAGWGARNLSEVLAIVAACPSVATATPGPGGVAPIRYAKLQSGPDFVVVREETWAFGNGEALTLTLVRLIVVVRVGDQVATVILPRDADAAAIRARTVARLS